jgi:trehalose 6-phosphate phosphatase
VEAEARLARLAEAPERAALFLDVDGTLAPIVPRPEQARVPEETRRELARLTRSYGLVACISGRPGGDAAALVGVDGIRYVGVHGLELEPDARAWSERLHEFASTVPWPIEDKELTVAFHYREAADEGAARAELERIAKRAREAGLVPHFGRKVLELRPPVDADKGTAVTRLLAKSGLSRALYAGDDTTDLDAFAALEGLEVAVRVAIASAEGPRELMAAADLVVEGPEALLELLRAL